MISKYLMLSLIDKVTTGHEAGLASTAGVFDISEIMQCFTHVKSSSISQLIKGKLRDL